MKNEDFQKQKLNLSEKRALEIIQHFEETMKNKAKIVKIRRIQNKILWD